MNIIKNRKDTLIQWLRNNGPTPADVISGHVLGGGSQNVDRTNQILRVLMREGLVAPIDKSDRPLVWSVTRAILPQTKEVKFPIIRKSYHRKAA